LVGANNSGKTNFVDSIDFLADVYRYGLEIAVNRKGGFENIAHRKKRRTKSPVTFVVHAVMAPTEVLRYGLSGRASWQRNELHFTHEFDIEAKGQAIEAAFRIRKETVIVTRAADSGDGHELLLDIVREGDIVQVNHASMPDRSMTEGHRDFLRESLFPFAEKDYLRWLGEGTGIEPTELLVGLRSYNGLFSAFARAIGNSRVYQLAPLESRRSGVPTPNPELGRHGANLPAFVAQLRKSNPELWEQVLQMMRRLVPGLEDIRTEFTPDRRLTLQFVEKDAGRPWSTDEVSDGTIQSLALFVALFDPRSELVVVEEPENSVHPWIVRNFVDACRSATQKQVLVTTHSPALINYLRPDEIAVLWRHGGETTLKQLVELDPEAMALWADGKVSTFEVLDSGWVPEAVPGGGE
jgi:predicted ATPase